MRWFKPITRKLSIYINYPNQFWADFHTFLNRPKCKKLGIKTLSPNYLYFDWFDKESIIIDVGCGFLAEFSCKLIEEYGLSAYGVDPTLKHKVLLEKIENKYKGRFKHIPVAISKTNGLLTFNETLDHESGSILNGHQNILRDSVRSYEVESMTLKSLVASLNLTEVDLIKLDLEGAEFELFQNINRNDLEPFKQLFIEFHHHAVRDYSAGDTKDIVRKIRSFGFKSFSLDHINFLFYR